MSKINFTIDEVISQLMKNTCSIDERLGLIFRLNNANMLKSRLQELTNDYSYEINEESFIDAIEFFNDNGQHLILDESGFICHSSSFDPDNLNHNLKHFENMSVARFSKTNRMMSGLQHTPSADKAMCY